MGVIEETSITASGPQLRHPRSTSSSIPIKADTYNLPVVLFRALAEEATDRRRPVPLPSGAHEVHPEGNIP